MEPEEESKEDLEEEPVEMESEEEPKEELPIEISSELEIEDEPIEIDAYSKSSDKWAGPREPDPNSWETDD